MLKGKVVLITGAAGGIGSEAAMSAAKNHAIVIANYHTEKNDVKAILEEIRKCSPKSIAVKADVSKAGDVDRMMKLVLGKFKRIDTIVNNANAAIAHKPFSEVKWTDFQKQLNVSLLGSMNVIRVALPAMTKAKSGKIINILSSVTLGVPPAKPVDYITAKYALLGFSKALAVELGPSGITVNCISPGMTDTDMIKGVPEKLKELVSYQTPLKRLAVPHDIANVVTFLCSDLSDYITGANIPVAGGNVM